MGLRTVLCIFLLTIPALLDSAASSDSKDEPKLEVQALAVQTSVPLTPAEQQQLTARLRTMGWRFYRPQSTTFTKEIAEELVREAYQDKGYFRVQVSSELVSIRGLKSVAVKLVVHVTPGDKYHLTKIAWKGMVAFSERELANLIQLRTGEFFSRSKIANGLEAAKKLYSSARFINATFVPEPEVNDEAATIAFTIEVDEGGQFHFGALNVQGMREEHRQILLSAWEVLRGPTV